MFRHFYFYPLFTFAHRALCAAAILLRPAADIVRLVTVAPADGDIRFAQRALCAAVIFRRVAGETLLLCTLPGNEPDPIRA
jgi:hypothetical protein